MCVPKVQILMPYQREWIMDRCDLKVCEKSRRTGITWASALEAVVVASSQKKDGGMNVYFMTYAEEDSKRVYRKLRPLGQGSWRSGRLDRNRRGRSV